MHKNKSAPCKATSLARDNDGAKEKDVLRLTVLQYVAIARRRGWRVHVPNVALHDLKPLTAQFAHLSRTSMRKFSQPPGFPSTGLSTPRRVDPRSRAAAVSFMRRGNSGAVSQQGGSSWRLGCVRFSSWTIVAMEWNSIGPSTAYTNLTLSSAARSSDEPLCTTQST